MLLTILIIAALWTIVSVVVVGCCVSAAQGDGAGWTAARARTLPPGLADTARDLSRTARRAGHAA